MGQMDLQQPKLDEMSIDNYLTYLNPFKLFEYIKDTAISQRLFSSNEIVHRPYTLTEKVKSDDSVRNFQLSLLD